MVLGWYWDGIGMVLGWVILGGIRVVLGWYWGGIGVVLGYLGIGWYWGIPPKYHHSILPITTPKSTPN